MNITRRNLIAGIGGLSVGLASGDYFAVNRLFAEQTAYSKESEKHMEIEVSAVEDLMREHSVLRRALFIYSESADRLGKDPAPDFPADALQKTAKLFRAFGEDYHEKKLEETYIFPAVKKAGGQAAGLTDILIAQHNRGREITDYILSVTKKEKLSDDNARTLADILRTFVRMYRPHAAREDTVVFPAWKLTLTAKELDEMNDTCEDIEHQMLGENGFENAVKQISEIERELGMVNLSQFTAPAPPSL
jgi:hemerythrin-like domain-containing protein